jgi:hypothetical protein
LESTDTARARRATEAVRGGASQNEARATPNVVSAGSLRQRRLLARGVQRRFRSPMPNPLPGRNVTRFGLLPRRPYKENLGQKSGGAGTPGRSGVLNRGLTSPLPHLVEPDPEDLNLVEFRLFSLDCNYILCYFVLRALNVRVYLENPPQNGALRTAPNLERIRGVRGACHERR